MRHDITAPLWTPGDATQTAPCVVSRQFVDWNDVRYFLALARTGSVRAAGAALSVSHSTVLRRVEALEERLHARLFDRSRDGYVLSDAGRQMLAGAERIEAEMAALERGVVGQDERLQGPVSITCSDAYMSRILVTALAGLTREHPGIELALTIDGRPFDLARREADIAVRALAVDGVPPEFLLGQKVVPIMLSSYVGVAHAARLDPELPGSATRWASYDDRKLQESMIAGSSHPSVPAWGSFASVELMVQAAEHGLGLAMLPTYVGDRVPALRRLARPDLRHVGDFWVLSHPDLRDNARIRKTRAAVADALRAEATLFRGTPDQ
ncbi:MAG: LysR family transcriptional regulator [Sandaracinaceae bacterium]|nr:LysR family transcriptional regulator [Sandaracinaceae bacterium]MBK8592305.1 LysR family transcriptional regulator [Sandaracinaceae bacterium]